MAKDKYDFIQELLENKKLQPTQKERVLLLAKEEIKKDGALGKKLEERVKKLEEMININTHINFTSNHNPKSSVKFLNGFSKNDELKWFSHKPDGVISFNYDDYILYANELLPKAPKIPINFYTYSNIRNFIFNNLDEKGNRYPCKKNDGNIKYTWFDMKNWCDNNPGIHPYNAQIDGVIFNIYINQFKNVIEFRNDIIDLNFYNRVKKLIKSRLSKDLIIDLKELRKVGQVLNVYIDTNLFFRSLEQILEWININKAKSNEVSFSLTDNGQYYQFEIFHKKSYISYKPNNPKILGQQGDFDKIRRNLFSVADWEIETILDDKKYYKIICLDENTAMERNGRKNIISENRIETLGNEINGVKHILKLYKNL